MGATADGEGDGGGRNLGRGHISGGADMTEKADGEIAVLLVEDHASYRQALEAVMLVEGDMRVAAQVNSVAEAGAAAARSQPAVALVDLDLPDGSGVEAIEAIREESPKTGCVVLSALTNDVEFGRAIQAGASAALHKSADIPSLLSVMRTVAAGGTVLPADETSRRLRALDASRQRHWHARVLDQSITVRERQILECLAEGADNRQIAERLGISPETVQTHVRNLLAKLDVGSRLEAVVKALRLGLVTPPN